MLIWVINSDHTLTPRMFLDWMNIFDFTLFKVVSKFIKVILFKINFGTIAAERNIVSTDKFLPSIKCLQCQTACQRFVCSKIHNHMKAKHFFVEFNRFIYISHYKHRILNFHQLYLHKFQFVKQIQGRTSIQGQTLYVLTPLLILSPQNHVIL